MTKIFHIVVGTGGHMGGTGAIEASYTVDGNTVTLCDPEDGRPLRDSWGDIVRGQMTPGQIINPRVVASRLALRRWRSKRDDMMEDFRRPLSNKDYAKVPA